MRSSAVISVAPFISGAAVLAAALALCFGCETTRETSDGRPMPPRARAVEPAPAAAPINAMSVLYGPRPADSNANGRPDRVTVELYLFARPYPVPTWREGTIIVSAYPLGQAGTPDHPGKKPFHEWVLPTSSLGLSQVKTLIGEGYSFQLTLLGDVGEVGGTDVVPGGALDFLARFEPKDRAGPVVWSEGVRSISFEPAGQEPGP